MQEQLRLDGKVVLVTGAGRGFGRFVACEFANRGAIIAANDITPINLDNTIASIRLSGGRTEEYIADISKMIQAQTLVDTVIHDLGRIDVLVCHAAVHPRSPLFMMDEWDWRHTIDVNLNGPFFLTQLVGQVMREQGGGVILYCLGGASFMADNGAVIQEAAYLSSKFGLLGLVRSAAAELAEHSIRVHAIKTPVDEDGANQKTCELMIFLCSQDANDLNGLVIEYAGAIKPVKRKDNRRSHGISRREND